MPSGELAELCRLPVAMRIAGAVFRGTNRLPTSISQPALLQRWYDLHFERAPADTALPRAIGTLAETMVQRDRGVLGETEAHDAFLTGGITDPERALGEALPWGLVLPTRIDSSARIGGEPAATFPNEYLLHDAYLRLSRAWRELDADGRTRTIAAAPEGRHLARAGRLFLAWSATGPTPFASVLVRWAPAALARLVGPEGRPTVSAEPLRGDAYFRRLLDAYRHLRGEVFGSAFRSIAPPWPESGGLLGLLARIYAAMGARADWGFRPVQSGEPDLVIERASPDEYPEWGGLDQGWPWWYPRGVRTVHHENLSEPQVAPRISRPVSDLAGAQLASAQPRSRPR